MKENKKKIVRRTAAAALGAALLCGTALAASTITSKTITAQYMGIQIVVDGVAVTPKDANGNVVEPFVSEGTTYLPVRAVGEALGKDVTWDGDTYTVYIGQVPGTEENWMTKLPPYQVNSVSKIYDGSDFRNSFTVAGVDYTSGVVLNNANQEGYALWNTNCLYSMMTFKVGHVDGAQDYNTKLTVTLDGTAVAEYDLTYDGGVQTITVPLNRAANVKLATEEAYGINSSEYAIYDISFAE